MTFEELFKKANMEIRLERHKAVLKSALLENSYFEERDVWDWKTFVPSLALSLILVAFSLNFPFFSDSPKTASDDNTFYSILSSSKNVSSAQESGANTLEMVDANAKTIFYFNSRNVLVHSEVVNIK